MSPAVTPRARPGQPWPTSALGTGRPELTGSRRQELNSGDLYLLVTYSRVSSSEAHARPTDDRVLRPRRREPSHDAARARGSAR